MAKKEKKGATLAQAKPEPGFLRWFLGHIFSALRRHGNVIAFWIGIGYVVRQVSLALIAYAGHTSVADLSLEVLANVSLAWTLSITLSGASITLYLRERKLHRKAIEQYSRRIIELESRLDSGRTSSQLTSEGLTQKGDE